MSAQSYDCESWVVRNEPFKFVAFERARAGSSQPPIVNVRWWLPEEERFAKRSLGLRVRDEDGKLDSDKIAAMLKLAGKKAQRIVDGKPWDEKSEAQNAETEVDGLTLTEGFRLALENKYTRKTNHRREVERVARDVKAIFGADATWDAVDEDVIETVVEKLAAVNRGDERWVVQGTEPDPKNPDDDREPRYRTVGWSWGRMILSVLFTVGRWLEEKKKIPRGTCYLPYRWKKDLRKAWKKETGQSTRKKKPRHSDRELAKLFRAASDAHPLAELGLELGSNLRDGQVSRSKRSNLDLAPVGAFECGTFEVVGPENKPGAFNDLTPEQRAVIDKLIAPDGLLGLLEAAYQAGEISDYSLFPQNALSYPDGQVPADAGEKPVDPRTMIRHFHDLEEIAGVTHVPGRAWYGVRRRMTDIKPRYTDDDRVLNASGGWRDTRSREDYQQDENPDVRKEVAVVQREARADLLNLEEGQGGQTAGSDRPSADASHRVIGSLFRSVARNDPEFALAILRGDEKAALGGVPVEELLELLEPADVAPLLQAASAEIVTEAVGVLMGRHGSRNHMAGASLR